MTADEARQALERIAAEAEERGEYDTHSPAGAAIDMVTPHLDLDWLIGAANDALRSGYAGYSYSNSSDGFATRRSGRPMRHYVLAHAVWRTDQRLDAQDDSRPNRIETEVLPTLVYTGRDEADHNQQLQLAIRLGWPGAFDFIYRHNWSRGISGSAPFDHDAVCVGHGQNAYVNGWLYLLLNLDRPEARAFRNRSNWYAFDVAARAVEGAGVSLDVEHLGFLFMDPDLGAESLAVKFWPRFLEATRAIQPGNGYWGLLGRVRYLARTEPNATDEMYREALATTTGEVSWIPVEGLESLPPKRRAEIYDIWINQLRAMADHPPKVRQLWTEPQAIAGLLKGLESRRKDIRRKEPSPGPGR
jgi:hypothetical protein